MGQILPNYLFQTCGIPLFISLILGSKVNANSAQLNGFNSSNLDNNINAVQWDLERQSDESPKTNQNSIIWIEINEYNEYDFSPNQVIWDVLSKEESNFTDEQLSEQITLGPIQPLVIPPSPLTALDRSISFADGFIGPDISWNIPNGLRWSQHWFGSASLRQQNRRNIDGTHYRRNGGEDVYIIHANILQTGSWSLGLNTTIQGGNSGQTGADNGSELGRSISSGFRIAKSISETAGVAFGGEQVFQWDNKTDTGRNLYLIATKGWWLGNQGNDYPLLIANGGFGTGRHANQDKWINPLRFACIEDFENRNGTSAVDNDLCWSPIGSLSIIFNDYVSTFVEYRSGTAQLAGSFRYGDIPPEHAEWILFI